MIYLKYLIEYRFKLLILIMSVPPIYVLIFDLNKKIVYAHKLCLSLPSKLRMSVPPIIMDLIGKEKGSGKMTKDG